MRSIRHGGRRGIVLAASVVAGIAGAACIGVAVAAQQSPPQPPAASAQAPLPSSTPTLPAPTSTPGQKTTPTGTAHASAEPMTTPAGLPRSAPTGIAIPAIGVDTSFVNLGLNTDGSIEVPADVTHVGWYTLGPAPGQLGPAIVLGHIDSAHDGPGVFYKLGALTPGDQVKVTRADGGTVSFTVYAVREYPKDNFPTATVYGNTAGSELRLITCGGSFDQATGHYRSNIVAFARQSGT